MRRARRIALFGAATVAVTLAGALPAQAAAPKPGRYGGRTSQKLPISLWAGQARKGELGRFVDHVGVDRTVRLREVAALKVRVACKGSGGSRWREVIPVQILGLKRNHVFSDSGSYTITRGRFAFSPVVSGAQQVLDESIRGRFKGRKAAGTATVSVTELATIPIDTGEVTFARCKSGKVKWSARLKKGGKHGIPKLAPPPEPKPRRGRDDTDFRQVLDGSVGGGDGGTLIYQGQGGSAFTAYYFKPGGKLLYCHRDAGGSPDYRSGTWSVTVGYLWMRPHDQGGRVDGELRLSVPGAVAASAAIDGNTASVSPSGGGLVAARGQYRFANPPNDTCQSLESGPG
jgi:hypothetical protein